MLTQENKKSRRTRLRCSSGAGAGVPPPTPCNDYKSIACDSKQATNYKDIVCKRYTNVYYCDSNTVRVPYFQLSDNKLCKYEENKNYYPRCNDVICKTLPNPVSSYANNNELCNAILSSPDSY